MIMLHSSHLSICVLNKGNNFCLLSKAGLSVVIVEEQYFDYAGVVVFVAVFVVVVFVIVFVIVMVGIPILEYSALLLPFVLSRVIV